jgi:Acyl-CoA dehydrogenase, N-terminal domain
LINATGRLEALDGQPGKLHTEHMTTTGTPVVDATTILAGARRIAPLLREQAAEVEAARRLTTPVVEALRSIGVFRMSVPRAWGGPEMDLLARVEILEVLPAADASAGWCAVIGADSGYYGAALADADGRELYSDLDFVTAGWVIPSGTLEITDGGYRLSGRWSFGSGCTHADVISVRRTRNRRRCSGAWAGRKAKVAGGAGAGCRSRRHDPLTSRGPAFMTPVMAPGLGDRCCEVQAERFDHQNRSPDVPRSPAAAATDRAAARWPVRRDLWDEYSRISPMF